MKALPILDERATGIDVGSERLHVSVGGAVPKVYGTMTCDVQALLPWLREQGVRSVAMEATGVYWMYLYEALQAAGFDVVVVNGRHVRNVPGRKTDMADCQWLATLHAHGLLRGGFVPPQQVRRLQDYMRLRQDHVAMAASHVQHMQKALERMNVKLHDQISDLTGVSGQKVVRAILAGERDPAKLLPLCAPQIRRRKAERVMESLRGIWKSEHLLALRHALQAWDFYQDQIRECDREIEQVLKEMAPRADDDPPPPAATAQRPKPANTSTPDIQGLHRILMRVFGACDPTELPGLADHSLLKLLSEVGTDLTKWPSDKHFTSWTGLAPGTAHSGKRRKNAARQLNRAGQIFCDIARSAANSLDTGFGGAFRRLRARRGGRVAMKALARKLAAMFWRVMVHGTDYVEQGLQKYQARAALTEQRLLSKLAHKHGMHLIPNTPQAA